MKLKNIKVIKNFGDLIIGKRADERSPYYFCRFYVGKKISADGYYTKSLKTKSDYDARRIAKEEYKKYLSGAVQMITPKHSKLYYFAELYLANKKRRIDSGEITYTKILTTQKNIIEKTIYPFFGKDRDVSTITYHDINTYLFTHLKDLTGKTRLNYKVLLKGILEFAVIEKCLDSLPVFPKITKGQPDSYVPYKDKEVSLIKDEIRRRIKSTDKVDRSNNRIYRELNDYIDFCRFAPFRPGREILLLQHKHIEQIQTIGGLKGLAMTPATRKVKSKEKDIAIGRPLLREIYLRILKRNPIDTGNEFLFYNYGEMRKDIDLDSMMKKITNIFIKIVKSLDLYKTVHGVRPMYSLRSSQLTDDKSQGLPIEDIAKNSNTSMKMLDSHYLVTYSSSEKEKLLEQLYGKDKRNPKNQK